MCQLSFAINFIHKYSTSTLYRSSSNCKSSIMFQARRVDKALTSFCTLITTSLSSCTILSWITNHQDSNFIPKTVSATIYHDFCADAICHFHKVVNFTHVVFFKVLGPGKFDAKYHDLMFIPCPSFDNCFITLSLWNRDGDKCWCLVKLWVNVTLWIDVIIWQTANIKWNIRCCCACKVVQAG